MGSPAPHEITPSVIPDLVRRMGGGAYGSFRPMVGWGVGVGGSKPSKTFWKPSQNLSKSFQSLPKTFPNFPKPPPINLKMYSKNLQNQDSKILKTKNAYKTGSTGSPKAENMSPRVSRHARSIGDDVGAPGAPKHCKNVPKSFLEGAPKTV